MIKFKITYFFIFINLFINNASAFETLAKQAIVIDYTTNDILFKKNEEEKMHPSSMSKLMTIYILFDNLKKGNLKLSDQFMVSSNAWKIEGSKMFVPVDTQVKIEDLIRGIIVQSGNDACIVVAEGISGSETEFAKLMNKKAAQIGLKNSHFVNATGLPDENHYMSAYDIAIISKKLIDDFPEFYHYFSENNFSYNNIKQENRNSLLSSNLGVDGLKTGHTEAGGYGVAISAKKDSRLILVTNGLKNTKERHEETLKLLQYSMLNFTNKIIAKKGEILKEIPIKYGVKKNIKLGATEDKIITILKSDLENIKIEYEIDESKTAPIKFGDKLGLIKVKINDNVNKIFELSAIEDIKEAAWIKRKWDDLKHLFN